MSPDKLTLARGLVQRGAYIPQSLAAELLLHLDVQEATINLLEARVRALEGKSNAAVKESRT